VQFRADSERVVSLERIQKHPWMQRRKHHHLSQTASARNDARDCDQA
jgi:hypothetical protein